VVGLVETVDWKLHYFCEDFQDQHAAWRQVANNSTSSCAY